ncbi:hypothetical protein Syun_003792 [Stephania yunnanensis]|uniref:DDE Tnp4 domain-containing protein n=1 Tax=Stephania yunnanensis TaxID=152371 RepID=A0AAP0L2T5_9MAGN
MDPLALVMLSNLLHLHNHLDPTTTATSLFSSPATSATHPLSPSATSSAAPLLFFTIASVLSYATCLRRSSSPSSPSSSSSPSPPSSATATATATTLSAFRALSTGHVWAMELLDHLKTHIIHTDLSLPPDYALSMVLSRLSHGFSTKTLAHRYSLDPYLVSKITNMVTRLLATKLYPEFVKIPVAHSLLQIIHAFRDLTALPNICGAIDGAPVKLNGSNAKDLAAFRCRQGFPAVLLQVVADHRKIFWDVCVRAPGGTDDATHFRDSLLYNKLISAEILKDSVVSVRGHHVRPYIVGDWCYPLMSFLLTPFSSNGTGTPAQNYFDAALMRGRSVATQAIGLLKGRWRILQNLNVGLNHAPQTIVACCVLHNFCQIAGEPELDPSTLFKEPKETGAPAQVLENEKSFYYFGESLRQAIADDLQERQQQRTR